LLLAYFNEITDAECGVCDVCIQKKRFETKGLQDNSTSEKVTQQVLLLLENGSMSPQLILQIMNPNNRTAFQGIIRQMIEDELLYFSSEGNIGIHPKNKKSS
jgi:ATP-dependent DNA helicase RecQ